MPPAVQAATCFPETIAGETRRLAERGLSGEPVVGVNRWGWIRPRAEKMDAGRVRVVGAA
jgi:hypothetical protein